MAGRALIGYTGFVGSLLDRAGSFEGHFNSKDVERLADREWDEVVCAGMPAEKWRANREPDADAASLERLWQALSTTKVRRVVLLSTVDVFDPPVDADEEAAPTAAHAYGAHRAELERRVLERFDAASVVRLPALYGPGLKKNALYDLLQGRPSPAPRGAAFQWYDLERLPGDLEAVRDSDLRLVQLVVQPVSMAEVIDRCFPDAEISDGAGALYDLRTRNASLFGGGGDYIEDRDQSLKGIARFVARVRSREVECASPSP